MLRLNNIAFDDNGSKIIYNYETIGRAKKYFDNKNLFYAKYQVDTSEIPSSILVIPFIANTLPIAWFAGFDIEIDEIDEDFLRAANLVKEEFQNQFPEYQLTGNIKAKKAVKNTIKGNKAAMLFSGGVDAYATYIRVFDKTPDLITILGADIEINDTHQWGQFTGFIENEKLLENNKKLYIETNVRKFYTYHVELLLKDIGWWGKIQHGLSLIGSIAPLSYLNKYSSIYIASSYTEQIDIAWGSTPQADEKISWAGIKVFHDGYELKRQDKVDLISQFSTETDTNFRLRVCYSELRDTFNCSNCEKCFRTILGIILNGKNPNDYGFEVDENVYDSIFEILNMGGASRGMQYFWWELMEKAKSSEAPFIFENEQKENLQLERIRKGEIHDLLEAKIKKPKRSIERIKFISRNKLSVFYKLYRKLRH